MTDNEKYEGMIGTAAEKDCELDASELDEVSGGASATYAAVRAGISVAWKLFPTLPRLYTLK